MTLVMLPSVANMSAITIAMWPMIKYADVVATGDADLTLLRFGPIQVSGPPPPLQFPSRFFAGFPGSNAPVTLEFIIGSVVAAVDVGGDQAQTSVTFNATGHPFNLGVYNQIFFSCDISSANLNTYLFDFVVNSVNVSGTSSALSQFNGPAPSVIVGGKFGVPTLDTWLNVVTAKNPPMVFAGCQVWFNQRIAATVGNLAKFFRVADGFVYPVGGKIAADAFGVPDVWLERDNISGINFQDNQGTGTFSVVGTNPVDFTPDPTDDPPIS